MKTFLQSCKRSIGFHNHREGLVESRYSSNSIVKGYYNSNEYTFSPLQHYEQQQREVAAGAVPGAAVFPADNEDFVISMQTYQQVSRDWRRGGHVTPCSPLIGPQCPGCPAFSVPVPVPRYPDTAVTERAEERSLLARLAGIVRPALARARQLLRGGEQEAASRRVDTADSGDQAGAGPIMAGLAAIGMGLASYFSTNLGGEFQFHPFKPDRPTSKDASHLKISVHVLKNIYVESLFSTLFSILGQRDTRF